MQETQSTVFHFDPVTREFRGAGPALAGPAGDIQVPAFATLTAPPEQSADSCMIAIAGEVDPVAHTCVWGEAQSWRGQRLYRTSDGAAVNIGADGIEGWPGIGHIPEGLTGDPRPSTFYVWTGGAWSFDLVSAKEKKLALLSKECMERQASSFRSGAQTFPADATSVSTILSAAQIASVAKAAQQDYRAFVSTASGAVVELDADSLIALALALGEHQGNCRKTAEMLKAAVKAATDEVSLEAVAWPNEGG